MSSVMNLSVIPQHTQLKGLKVASQEEATLEVKKGSFIDFHPD